MKKILVAVAFAAFAQVASAAIATSAHDMTALGGTLSSCQYCHAPHNTNPLDPSLPLWNRNTRPAGDYTVSMGTPGPNSLTCMSCHDGTTNMGDMYTGSDDINLLTIGAEAGNPLTGQDKFNLTLNLSNDHPVGVLFPGGTPGFTAAPAIGLDLYGGNVECATCHDPHGNAGVFLGAGSDHQTGGESFLKVAAGGLCSGCHVK